MILKTNHYTFWAKIQKVSRNHYYYYFGNDQGKPIPYVSISLDKFDGKWYMVIQDIVYYSTCAYETMERGSPTIEMIQCAIKEVLKLHPKVDHVALNDTSHWNIGKERISLPEFRLLAKGKTWYQKYFGAEPQDIEVKILHKKYLEARKKVVSETQLRDQFASYGDMTISKLIWTLADQKLLTEKMFINILQGLHLKEIARNGWRIALNAVALYKFDGQLIDDNITKGGTIFHDCYKRVGYRFSVWH